MTSVRVGVVADPAVPTEIAREMKDLASKNGARNSWAVEVVSEPFTIGSEDVACAFDRLSDEARKHQWDLVVGLTELPLRDDDGRYLSIQTDAHQERAVLSLPALGGLRLRARTRQALRDVICDMAENSSDADDRVELARRSGKWRLLLGMVLANRPWLLVPGLKSALVAALATGAVATINATVWQLAGSLSWWRLVVATIGSIALVVAWLVIDGELWDRPEEKNAQARERSRLYNASTLATLTVGVTLCYLALYVINLLWALFILDPTLVDNYLKVSFNHSDLFVLAWFIASAATIGGGLGSGLESDDAIRAATYSKREEDRRARLARQGRSRA